MELNMRADRPLLVSAAFLGAGLWMIFRYATSGAGINATLPWSNVGFHLNVAENGPGAIGGVALTAIGALLFVWAIFAALGSLLLGSDDERERDFLRIVPSSTSEPMSESVDDSPPASFSEQRRWL
jgi:hypothetical protein